MSLRSPPTRDPWRRAPVGELQEQLLPRWFVVLALGAAVAAAATLTAAFVMLGTDRIPPQARRPPPSPELTSAVGRVQVGSSQPVVYERACQPLRGVRVAGTAVDQDVLRRGLASLCNTPLDGPTAARLRRFARAGGVVRFAQFQATGVDSTATRRDGTPTILVNAKFSRTNPRWIAPLVAHDATMLALDPGEATAALAARRAEHAVCTRLLAGERASRGCDDAAAVLNLPNPLAALRGVGFS